MGLLKKLKPGKYTNRKGKQYEVDYRLVMTSTAMLEDYFFSEPKPKGHSPAGILLTTNEIAEHYGSEEENKKS